MNNDLVQKVPEYYEGERREMLSFIPSSAQKILEIGCGQGKFSRILKKERQAEVWGIEMTQQAAEEARTYLDKVLVGDCTKLISELPKGYFDCVICNDVLEHLAYPADLLKDLKKVLVPAGRIVSSIPNVRFFENLLDLLLHKDWKYTDQGILDYTHLRFFTQKSIARLFNENGYTIETLVGINPTKSRLLKVLNLLTIGFLSDTRFLQFAVVAKSNQPT